MPNLTNPLAITNIRDSIHRQDPMIAIIVVALRVVQRHTPTDLTPMTLQRVHERLDRHSRGAARVLQEGADTANPDVGFLAQNVLAVGVPAVLIDVVEVVGEIAHVRG